MDYAELRSALQEPIPSDQRVGILRGIAQHVNNAHTHHEGRDLVIRALAVLDRFEKSQRAVLMTLVRNVGLFPYLSETIAAADVADQLAFELHRPDNADSAIVFHSLQARIYHQLLRGANVVLSASTSSGKSLVIDEIVASEKFRKIVIVVLTLALIDETRRRCCAGSGNAAPSSRIPAKKRRQTGLRSMC